MVTEKQVRLGSQAAFEQALKSGEEGGVPIGSALMLGDEVIAVGHNRRYQSSSNILHAEMDCIERAGHRDFGGTVLFTTLSPCLMCGHTAILYEIPTIVIMDDVNTQDYEPSDDILRARGVEVIIARHSRAIELNAKFQAEQREKWLGDVGK